MADHGILFSAPMVRALLAGRKTQTRRVLSKKPALDALAVFGPEFLLKPGNRDLLPHAIGDRLWVREAWSHSADHVFEIGEARRAGRGGVIYKADADPRFPHAKYWPSIFLPREFSRLTLTVTDMRVQRVQEISEADAAAEGIERNAVQDGTWLDYPKGGSAAGWADPRRSFKSLWNSLHGPDAWDANPWVVASTFTVRRGNIDAAREESRHDR